MLHGLSSVHQARRLSTACQLRNRCFLPGPLCSGGHEYACTAARTNIRTSDPRTLLASCQSSSAASALRLPQSHKTHEPHTGCDALGGLQLDLRCACACNTSQPLGFGRPTSYTDETQTNRIIHRRPTSYGDERQVRLKPCSRTRSDDSDCGLQQQSSGAGWRVLIMACVGEHVKSMFSVLT